MMKDKVAVLIGTRPGIIKMSPVIHELRSRNVDNIVIHTGQHFSNSMDRQIIHNVGIGEPDFQIIRPKGCESHAQQTAYMLTNIEKILLESKPQILLVCGDANTNLAGALASRKIHVAVGHVEAGLRSFDWRMPEEHNRVIIDHISEYLFAPTHLAKENLIRDGVQGKIFVVGNTIVEATLKHSEIGRTKVHSTGVQIDDGNPYAVLTLHREENVDNQVVLENLIFAIEEVAANYDLQILFPVHPRTKKRLTEFGKEHRLTRMKGVKMVHPMGYSEFLAYLSRAKVAITDSGGIQEESCILGIPCVTLRESTERQETLKIGANHLAGTKKERILEVFDRAFRLAREQKAWPNPYGDGRTAERIVDTCMMGRPENEWGD
jgi:UDP-N-acetylglucosamine 2-epimerase (non-hydrolysing)